MCSLITCEPCRAKASPEEATHTVELHTAPRGTGDCSEKENNMPQVNRPSMGKRVSNASSEARRRSIMEAKRMRSNRKEELERLRRDIERRREEAREEEEIERLRIEQRKQRQEKVLKLMGDMQVLQNEEELDRLRREQEQQRQEIEAEKLQLQEQFAQLRQEQELHRQATLHSQRELKQQRELDDHRRKMEQEEERRLSELERLRGEAQEKQVRLSEFLERHGFSGINEKKLSWVPFSGGFTYPLHVAAEEHDATAVELLLWAGADRWARDSSNRTALSHAWRLDSDGSHGLVMQLLATEE